MLKISILEDDRQRRLILEGTLVGPWTAELRTAYDRARADLRHRQLVVDVKNLTAINQEGENVLLDLMRERVTFCCSGVFTKHVVAQLANRVRRCCPDAKS